MLSDAMKYNFENEIKQLKAQIEKMKCCENCKHRLKICEMEIFDLDKDELKEPCNTCKNYSDWELLKI